MNCTEEELEALLLECQVDNPEFNKADLRLGLHKHLPSNIASKDWALPRMSVLAACKRMGHKVEQEPAPGNAEIMIDRCKVCQVAIM